MSNLTLQKKLNIVFIIIFLFYVIGIAAYWVVERSAIEKQAKNYIEEQKVLAKKLIDEIYIHFLAFVEDYSVYDGTVKFIKSKDLKWAKENIYTALNIFDFDAIWIYSPEFELVYSACRLCEDQIVFPVQKNDIGKLFVSSSTVEFFSVSEGNLFKVAGSTVHPTTDREKKTTPQGYIFAAQAWDKKRISVFEDILKSKIQVVAYSNEISYHDYHDKQGYIYYFIVLNNWKGLPDVVVHIQKIYPQLERAEKALILNVVFWGIYVLFVFFVLIYFIGDLIIRPINKLKIALCYDEPEYLKGISESNVEFYDLALLINNFYEQKARLTKEILIKQKTEANLLNSQKRLRVILDSFTRPLCLLESNGIIGEFNVAFLQLVGLSKSDVVGKKFVDFIDENDKEKFLDLVNEHLFIDIHTLRIRVRDKNGTVIKISATIKSVKIQEKDYFLLKIRRT